jgi:hypothetical protein
MFLFRPLALVRKHFRWIAAVMVLGGVIGGGDSPGRVVPQHQ